MLGGRCTYLPEAMDGANPPSNNSKSLSLVAVKSEQLSLRPETCRAANNGPSRCVLGAPQVRQQLYRFKATPAETPAPGKEVILVYFHSVVPVPSSSCLLLKTYLFVKSVPPPRSHGLCPPLPPPLPPLPVLGWPGWSCFPGQDHRLACSCGCNPLPPPRTHPPSQLPLLAYSSLLPPPTSNTSKLML